MSQLSSSRAIAERDGKTRLLTAGAKIYAGGIVALNASGLAVPAAASSGLSVIGRAENNAESGGGVKVKRGTFAYDSEVVSGAAVVSGSHIGHDAYIVDDQTVTVTSGLCSAGKIFDVDPDGVWITIG